MALLLLSRSTVTRDHFVIVRDPGTSARAAIGLTLRSCPEVEEEKKRWLW
jgi:predicted ribosome-associated RNA-binding protein Tma20